MEKEQSIRWKEKMRKYDATEEEFFEREGVAKSTEYSFIFK